MQSGDIQFTGFEHSGLCWWCEGELTGRKRRFCCEDHRELYWQTYNWQSASLACIRRANHTCENCHASEQELWIRYEDTIKSRLEIHHIIPVNGENRAWHKLNKPENLICLCHECHLEIHHVMRPLKNKRITDLWEEAKKTNQMVMELEVLV